MPWKELSYVGIVLISGVVFGFLSLVLFEIWHETQKYEQQQEWANLAVVGAVLPIGILGFLAGCLLSTFVIWKLSTRK